MILWTIQPIDIWKMIQETGVYRCDPKQSSMPEPEFVEKYEWLIRQMKKRIGPQPEGVVYSVWAWYKQNGKRKKPDLRSERWGYGPGDEDYTCIEFEMLLYARTDDMIQPDNTYQMSGNRISVKTLNLNRDFSEIANQLNSIVDEHFQTQD